MIHTLVAPLCPGLMLCMRPCARETQCTGWAGGTTGTLRARRQVRLCCSRRCSRIAAHSLAAQPVSAERSPSLTAAAAGHCHTWSLARIVTAGARNGLQLQLCGLHVRAANLRSGPGSRAADAAVTESVAFPAEQCTHGLHMVVEELHTRSCGDYASDKHCTLLALTLGLKADLSCDSRSHF